MSGCLGRIIIWQMEGAVRWVSPPINDNMSISNLALLEPTDDPRPYCYLWASYQGKTLRQGPVLRMYALLFERKYPDKGSNAYSNLEGEPRLKFEFELDEGNRVTNLHPIVRENNLEQSESGNKRGEENLLLITLDCRTLLFDLNQWYKEQMPQSIGDCQNPNAFLASYRTRRSVRLTTNEAMVSCSYLPSTLKEFPSHGSSPPEELFFPNSLSLEWVDLCSSRLTYWMTRGVQAELLREMLVAGPVIVLEPSETFHRCLSAGLIPVSAEVSLNSDKDAQRETILSLCLEQRWLNFLLRCGREWSDGSASYLLHAFVRWGMQRVATIKLTAHNLCVPLFDHCGISIGDAEVRNLRFFSQQLECISNVFANLSIDSMELTKQRRSLHRISTYLQVLLWFYDVGLLPETQEIDDEAAPLSFSPRIPYPFERLATIYSGKREQLNARATKNCRESNEENLFIDDLLTRECPSLKLQWESEVERRYEFSVGGNYPPPSLQSLLRSYLTDCHKENSNEVENKHQITIYLLMDLAMLLQESYPDVDQLIKYPSAFKLSPSLIKLTQALWLLDHKDYQGFLDMMTGQLVSDSDVKDWHHKLVLRTLIRENQNKFALIYLRVRKPPLSSLEDQGVVISLSVEHGLVQSAFHRRPPSHYSQLLTRFFRACKLYGKLNDILHLSLDSEEEAAFVKFLEDEKSDDARLLYYLQRSRYAEASNVYPPGAPNSRGDFQKSNRPVSLTIFNAYNVTLPGVTRKFSGNVNRQVLDIDPDSRYPRPMSHCKSRVTIREIHDTVIRKAKETFVRGERSHIPFISAPCSSLRTGPGNVDTNCVLFVERARKPYGKRSLDEVDATEDSTNNDNNGEERKRRKTFHPNVTPDSAEGREVGMSMVFDTPLVKRKTQVMNTRNTPAETPHSILKIRQLIRDSTSPSVTGTAPIEVADVEKIIDKERKPRQIRFSIGQRRADESMEAEKAQLANENMALDEANEDSDETEKSLSKCDVSEEEQDEDVQEAEEGYEESESTFFSTNVSAKTLSDTTLLSDSSYSLRNVSGPRPRPSLRRSNISSNESSSDLLRKSLMKATDASTKRSWSSTPSDSAKVTSDFSSLGKNKSFGALGYSQSPSARASLLYSSTYSESILTTDTSFESTPAPNYTKSAGRSTGSSLDRLNTQEKSDSFIAGTADKFRDFSRTGLLEINDNLSRFSRSVAGQAIIRENFAEEYSRDDEEDTNSEVLMEVDGFGLDRNSDSRLPSDRESTCELDRIANSQESISRSMAQSFAIPEVSEMKEKEEGDPGETREENNVEEGKNEKEDAIAEPSEHRDVGDGWRMRDVSSTKNEIVENTEETETNDAYDDELLALKYDEDDEPEETFQSLTNSVEIDCSSAKLDDRSTANDKTKKNPSSNNGFYETPKLISQEFTITDDESSHSVEGLVTSNSTNVQQPIEIPDDIESAQKSHEEIIPDNFSNMTDDESDLSCDSSIFSSKFRTRLKKNNDEKIYYPNKVTNDVDESSSRDSLIFSPGKSKEYAESNSRADCDKTANDGSSIVTEVVSHEDKESVSSEFRAEDSPLPRKGRQSARLSKIGLLTPQGSAKDIETRNSTPLRITRSRRASSVVQEALTSPLPPYPAAKSRAEEAGRFRQGSSLAKDLFAVSDNKPDQVASTKSDEPQEAVLRNRAHLRRSTSLAKETTATNSLPVKKISTDEELPVRRRTRRAASVQKEISASTVTRKIRTRSSSKTFLAEGSAEEKQLDVSAARRTTRGKRGSSESKESTEVIAGPSRMTRASSLAKEAAEENVEISQTMSKRLTRKRGSSLPKESPLETSARVSLQRSTRGGSVAKEIIPEESSRSPDESKNFSSSRKINEAISPLSRRRTRLTSITSIAEEDNEEIFSVEPRGQIIKERKKSSISRERRAISVDQPLVEVKRRTRAESWKSAISKDPIEEETSEIELPSGPKGRATRKAPARRKRTASGTSVNDYDTDADAERLPSGRPKKLSERSNDNTSSFRFSPPDQVQDRPGDDQKGKFIKTQDAVTKRILSDSAFEFSTSMSCRLISIC